MAKANIDHQENDVKAVPLEEIPAPPDGGWGWVVCVASFFCNMILDGIAYSFGILLGPLVFYFGSSRGTVSWVGSLFCGIYMASGPVVGGLVNKFGCRPVCIAGAFFSCFSLVLSTFSPNVGVLMLTYGIMGGFGVGCIYLPAVIACGYYFEKRRALATGIAVCGSGVGTFVFAPLASYLLDLYGWKGANMIFAALCFNCAICGSLMRPLELVITSTDEQTSPLISVSEAEPQQPKRLWEEASLREEDEVEFDDGFHDASSRGLGDSSKSTPRRGIQKGKDSMNMKNRLTVSAATSPGAEMKRNRSTPGFGRLTRLDSDHEREVQQVLESYDRRASSYLVYAVQDGSTQQLKPYSRRGSRAVVRPLSRKDIFYSGSIYNLALDMNEDQKMLNDNALKGYRQSIISIPRTGYYGHRGSVVASHLSIPIRDIDDPSLLKEKLESTHPILSVFKEMMDFEIMLNPLFVLICISNILGFLAVYIPYMYLPNMTYEKGIDNESAAFIISLIGVSNTLGRVVIGAIVDMPCVSSLVVTNLSLIFSGLCVFAFPFCQDYTAFMMVALLFGLSVSAFISLVSIVLVDLLGLDSLTSSFGMTNLGRGLASVLGPPLGGLVFDWTREYFASFFMAGSFFVTGGLLGFVAYFMDKCKKK